MKEQGKHPEENSKDEKKEDKKEDKKEEKKEPGNQTNPEPAQTTSPYSMIKYMCIFLLGFQLLSGLSGYYPIIFPPKYKEAPLEQMEGLINLMKFNQKVNLSIFLSDDSSYNVTNSNLVLEKSNLRYNLNERNLNEVEAVVNIKITKKMIEQKEIYLYAFLKFKNHYLNNRLKIPYVEEKSKEDEKKEETEKIVRKHKIIVEEDENITTTETPEEKVTIKKPHISEKEITISASHNILFMDRQIPSKNKEARKDQRVEGESILEPFIYQKQYLYVFCSHNNFGLKDGHALRNIGLDIDLDYRYYIPTLNFTNFWNLKETKKIIREGDTIPVTVYFKPIYFQTLLFMASYSKQDENSIVSNLLDIAKKVINTNDSNSLCFSLGLAILHFIFSFFIFKNEINFWKDIKSLKGISVNTIFGQFICEIIIMISLAYSEDTYNIALLFGGISLLITIFKITWIIHLKIDSTFPFIHVSYNEAYLESNTNKYDRDSFLVIFIFLIIGCIIFVKYHISLIDHERFAISIVNLIKEYLYSFGFLLIIPQIYINFRLKSTDHLPWRIIIYRSIPSFADDLAKIVVNASLFHYIDIFKYYILFIVCLIQRSLFKVSHEKIE